MNFKREGAVGTLIDNSKAMFCGGVGADVGGEGSSECYFLHQNGSWSLASPMIMPRIYPALSKLDQGFLVVGGSPNDDSIEFFNGQEWELLDAKLPVGLYALCMARLYSKLNTIVALQFLLFF